VPCKRMLLSRNQAASCASASALSVNVRPARNERRMKPIVRSTLPLVFARYGRAQEGPKPYRPAKSAQSRCQIGRPLAVATARHRAHVLAENLVRRAAEIGDASSCARCNAASSMLVVKHAKVCHE